MQSLAGMQARGMMGQIAPPLSRGSPPNHMLFAHPATSSLHTSANPSTVFLLTSSAPDPATFSQGGGHSPTFLTQFPPTGTAPPCSKLLSLCALRHSTLWYATPADSQW